MKDDTKAKLIAAIGQVCDDGQYDVTFRNTYSGRGMYGATCVGIVGSAGDCLKVIAKTINILTDALLDDLEGSYSRNIQSEFDDCVYALLTFNQDGMGCDVIYYWPRLSTSVAKPTNKSPQ